MTHTRFMGRLRCLHPPRTATRFALARRVIADRFTFFCLITLVGATPCAAGGLTISVLDIAGRGVSEAVVIVAPLEHASPTSGPATAVMDQHDLEFVPRVLVIAVGTSVEFPNSDSVSHQVYSFSPAKTFQLPLYKGARHPPVIFDRAGLVVLGCNIHDDMVGYIYVTDAPFFGKTDASGGMRLANLSDGDYRVTVWSPFIADPPATLSRTVHVNSQEVTDDRLQLTHALRSRPQPRPRRSDWDY